MAQQLRKLTALPGDPGTKLDPCRGTLPSVILVSGNLLPSCGLSGYCMYMIHVHTGKKTYIHKTITTTATT